MKPSHITTMLTIVRMRRNNTVAHEHEVELMLLDRGLTEHMRDVHACAFWGNDEVMMDSMPVHHRKHHEDADDHGSK